MARTELWHPTRLRDWRTGLQRGRPWSRARSCPACPRLGTDRGAPRRGPAAGAHAVCRARRALPAGISALAPKRLNAPRGAEKRRDLRTRGPTGLDGPSLSHAHQHVNRHSFEGPGQPAVRPPRLVNRVRCQTHSPKPRVGGWRDPSRHGQPVCHRGSQLAPRTTSPVSGEETCDNSNDVRYRFAAVSRYRRVRACVSRPSTSRTCSFARGR
jgi:hypothetical protein